MKRSLIIFAFIAAICAPAYAQKIQHFAIKVGNFTELKVASNLNVEYRCSTDSAGYAVFDAYQDMANLFIFDNNSKGRLQIKLDTDDVTRRFPTIRVYSSYLASAENSGDSLLIVHNVAQVPQLKLKTSDEGRIIAKNVDVTTLDASITAGKGSIEVTGRCTEAKLNCKVGSSEINAKQLMATNVSCWLVGSGEIGCIVNGGILSIKGSGNGKVYYKGKPSQISVKQIGSIKAIAIDE